jgi:hypothetical protein
MKTAAHWMLVTTDLGGMVRVNVHDQAGTGRDIDTPLADLPAPVRRALTAALGAVAAHLGATVREMAPAPASTAPPGPPAKQSARATRRAR